MMKTRTNLIIAALLAVVTLAVYAPSLRGQFLEYDDEQYITQNPHVLKGITLDGIAFAFKMNGYAANWHPVTWMSHMLDANIDRLIGARVKPSVGVPTLPEGAQNPWLHHLSNVLIHIATTLLLFFALTRMTNSPWKSAFVASLFALHPFHVESVAWVAERKDVLSGMFWMLSMLAYVWYTERPGALRYTLLLVSFTLGLMAKPMLVTLPIALLLLDWWPLGRIRQVKVSALITEKLPLFSMTIASCIITYVVQQRGGAMGGADKLGFAVKIGNAILSYGTYILKTFWPVNFANPYPHPGLGISALLVFISAVFLIGISIAAFVLRRHSYLPVGWLWYLVTLVPVIGIIQVGEQAMADRYTYIPLIGIFVMIAWGIPELFTKKEPAPKRSRTEKQSERAPNTLLVAPALFVLAVLSTLTVIQTGYWHDSISLFQHALEVAPDNNSVAHNNLAKGYEKLEKYDKAEEHYRQVVELRPSWAEGHNNLAFALEKLNRPADAYKEYTEAIAVKEAEIGPDKPDANIAKIHINLGRMLAKYRKNAEAAEQFRKAIFRGESTAAPHYNLACAIESVDPEAAIAEYRRAIELDPAEPKAHNNLGVQLYKKGDYAGAWREVHLCQDNGGVAIAPFVEALRHKMPEPAR